MPQIPFLAERKDGHDRYARFDPRPHAAYRLTVFALGTFGLTEIIHGLESTHVRLSARVLKGNPTKYLYL